MKMKNTLEIQEEMLQRPQRRSKRMVEISGDDRNGSSKVTKEYGRGNRSTSLKKRKIRHKVGVKEYLRD